jgi:hypothetical protein
MLPPLNTVVTEHWHLWHVVSSAIGAIGGWEAVKATVRGVANKIINAMPPLPANANWRQTWFYNIAKAFASEDAIAAHLMKTAKT